ncbi:MAG: RsmE family RNA methyltransferase [Candidatus Cloacimonadaceae bacterium]
MPSSYYPDLNITDQLLTLSGEEFHHLVRVTRAREGSIITLNSGKGSLATARVVSIDSKQARLELVSIQEGMHFPIPYAIAFALLKNRHDELLVEKCTELGAGRFFPLLSRFTIRKGSHAGITRFERIALAAIKQCDNPILPTISPIQSLKEGLRMIQEEGYRPILCSEDKPKLWLSDLGISPDDRPCFIIGPEGGWSDEEKQLFTELNIDQISIGYLVSRAETAGITIAAQWLLYANRHSTMGTT